MKIWYNWTIKMRNNRFIFYLHTMWLLALFLFRWSLRIFFWLNWEPKAVLIIQANARHYLTSCSYPSKYNIQISSMNFTVSTNFFLKNPLNSVNRFCCVALTSVEPFHTVYSLTNKSIFTMSKGIVFRIVSSAPSTSNEKKFDAIHL